MGGAVQNSQETDSKARGRLEVKEADTKVRGVLEVNKDDDNKVRVTLEVDKEVDSRVEDTLEVNEEDDVAHIPMIPPCCSASFTWEIYIKNQGRALVMKL